MQWFDIDKQGLAKILARKGKAFAALELLQNAWDQDVTAVELRLEKPAGSRTAILTVIDDDPNGFSDLGHAFTLFADSAKKSDPTKRGRFNLGEKLVLALCDEAEIRTVSGSVRFDKTGRHRGRKKTLVGSSFVGRMRMTNKELDEALIVLHRVIPPDGIRTSVNGVELMVRSSLATFDVALPTEISDEEGYLRRVTRKATVEVFATRDDEVAMLYEMGIPVVETRDRYHCNVGLKVPLSMERDNVGAPYLKKIRTAVLNHLHEDLDEESASDPWIRDALSDKHCAPDAAASVIRARFGKKAVAYDPSDPEANKLATARGYTIVHGGHLSSAEWQNVRKANVLPPAGQVTPSPKPFSDSPDAPVLKVIPESDWSSAEQRRVGQLKRIALELIGSPIIVKIANDRGWQFEAAFGGTTLTVNRARLGGAWFEGPLTEQVLSLLIHELGHYYCGDHLSHRFYDALCDLAGRLALAVSRHPELLRD